MDHYHKRRRGVRIFLHIHPSPSNYMLGSDRFRRGDTVLVSSRTSCSKINGGRLGDSGDNEDYNRRQTVSEEPHRCCTCMKSSMSSLFSVFHFCPVPYLMEWRCRNRTRVQYSEMIGPATLATAISRHQQRGVVEVRGRFLTEEPPITSSA